MKKVIPIYLQYLLISFVMFYQRFAPAWVRKQCLYYPCCSDYMVLSIKKNGSLFGAFKGVCRICRCRKPYGGVDFP